MPYPVPPDLPDPPDPWELRAGVRLVRPSPEHIDDITAAVQAPDIRRFTLMPDPYERSDAEMFVSQIAEGSELAMFLEEDGRLIGGVGLAPNWREWSGEVGYWLVPEARGRGLIHDAVRELCRFGFEQIGLRRIQLHAAANNPASNRVAEQLGFTREGVLRSAHIDGSAGRPDQPRSDLIVWGLLPGELVE